MDGREISLQPKLPRRIISFFPEKFWWWFLSHGLCSFKSLWSVNRGVWEEKHIQNSAWTNSGFQRYGHQSIIDSSKICTSLSSRILYCLSLFFFELVAFCCFKSTFSPNYNYVPHLCFYVFYFIFYVNYPVYYRFKVTSLIFNQFSPTLFIEQSFIIMYSLLPHLFPRNILLFFSLCYPSKHITSFSVLMNSKPKFIL